MHYSLSDGSPEDVCHPERLSNGRAPGSPSSACVSKTTDELIQARKALKLSEARLESLLRIVQHKFISAQELLDFALEEGIKLTGSKIGFIHYYDEQAQRFTCNSWSKEVMAECRISGNQPSHPLELAGMWGEAVRRRHPIIVNDFARPEYPLRGYPSGHAPLHRFMSIPVFSNDDIVAAIGVANKGIDYDDSDVRQLTLLMDTVWKIVLQKRTEEEYRESERRLRVIFETSQAGIVMLDQQGVITFANRSMAEMFGCDVHELIGSSYTDRLNPVDKDSAMTHLRNWLNGQPDRESTEWPYLRGNDDNFWGHLSLKSLKNVDGSLQSLVGIITDISDRKLAEDARNRALFFVETLLAQSPMGIRIFDGETGDCILANRAAVEIAAGNEPSLLKQNFRRLASWRQAGITAQAEAVLKDGQTRRIATELRTTFGQHKWVEYLLSCFTAEDKPHLMVIGLDITEEKRLEDENRHIEAQMQHMQKLESLGVLAGGIAHDFNNILTTILGNADLALMQLSPTAPVRSNVLRIEQAASRAAELARQMLAYSGKGHFVIEQLDLNVLIRDMIQMLDVSITKKATLSFECADNLPAIDGDASQLSQVIMNLVINASEAIGDQPGVITITTGSVNCDREYLTEIWVNEQLPEGRYVFLEIRDNGCGMSPETAAKIFEPFYTTKFTGRGLGMAVTLGIVRGHRGAITVSSQVGKGATFRILLPCSDQAAPQAAAEPEAVEQWYGTGTVLLVDDEETIRNLGGEMLMLLGFKALTAVDGIDALQVYQEKRENIDCVMLDLTMPRMDGEQAFRKLREISPELPVIMCSGYSEQDMAERFHRQGVNGFLQKPYKLSDLENVLRNLNPPQRPTARG